MVCSTSGFPVLHYLPEFAQTHVHWVDDTIQLSLHIKWPKDWSFSFSISPSDENSGLISFRTDWFDPLAVQGTFKSLLQHHSPKASGLLPSDFFMVQLSHLYMTTEKTIALTVGNFVGKVLSLLFNTLSRFATAFLSRSKCWTPAIHWAWE